MRAESADHPANSASDISQTQQPYTLAAQQAALIGNVLLPAAALAGPLRQGKQPAGAGKHQQHCKFCNRLRIDPRGNRHRNPSSPRFLHIHGVISHTPAVVKLHLRAQQIHLRRANGNSPQNCVIRSFGFSKHLPSGAANQFIPVSAGGFHPLQAIFRKCAQHCNLFHDTLRSPSVLF